MNVSTDKAANPTRFWGIQAYRGTVDLGMVSGPRAPTVGAFRQRVGESRFGFHRLHEQIEDGGPLTVTDPEVPGSS